MRNQTTIRKINVLSSILLFISLFVTVKGQTINLQLQNDYTSEGAAYAPSITVGDVNNDGRPDVVATNRQPAGGDYIGVYLNNGAGGFNTIPLQAGNNFSARVVALGDFNKDGNLDMAIGRDNINVGLNVRLGDGTGNFPIGTDIGSAIIESISDLVTADFNGDGNLDLAFTKSGGYNTAPSHAVKVYFGNGTGGFSGFSTTALSFGGARDIEVSDFNVDGRPDIAATAPNSNVVQVLINNGAGGFNAPVSTTSIGAAKLASADFNRDCLPDLAVSRTSSNVVSIFLGNGAGGFGAPSSITTNATGETSLAVGDFNRDRKVDLVIRNVGIQAANFIIRSGDGTGGFPGLWETTLSVSDAAAQSLAVLDANLDGKVDIVTNRQGGFTLYHGNSALFTRTENDFDGDLRADLSVFRPSSGEWHIQRSTLGSLAQVWGISTDKLTPADFDGDGKTDIAVWREAPSLVAAFYILNSSTNTLRTEQFGQTGDDPKVVGDWDGDGKADPAVYRNAAFGSQSYFFYRGSVNNPTGITTYLPWGTDGDLAVRGDFDGDGKQDAAVFRSSSTHWYILRSSNGQGVSQNWGLITDRRVTLDYDGDGKTDFAVFRPSNNSWYILNSATSVVSFIQWGSSGDSLVPGDYNGDGKAEIAVYRPSNQLWFVPQCGDFKLNGDKFGTSGDIAVPSAYIP